MANTKESLIIQLSFKQNEKWLYKELKKNNHPSTTIKDILVKHYNGELACVDNMNVSNVNQENVNEIENGINNTSPFDLF